MSEPPNTSQRPSGLKGTTALGVAWIAVPALAGFVLLAQIGPASDWITSHGNWGLVVYVLVFAITSGLGLLPTFTQAVLGGWVFGVWVGGPAAIAGFAGGSLVGRVVAAAVAGDRVEALIQKHERARAVRTALLQRGFIRTTVTITLLRLPPNSPFALMNLALTACRTRLWPYLIGTVLGMAPRTLILVGFAGAAASTGARDIQTFIKDGPGVGVFVGGIIALLIVLGILGSVVRRAVDAAGSDLKTPS